ncbi:hypothetical protein MNV49_001902 [Pseudohyphozyma bogoriensis]|nr:hypothetical protein MNV49_001902 [Pseudohyphozyma bogoriensis]
MSYNSYIVTFKKESDSSLATVGTLEELTSKVESSGGKIEQRYDSRIMRGFAGQFSEDLRKEFESHEAVKFVEPNGSVKTQ